MIILCYPNWVIEDMCEESRRTVETNARAFLVGGSDNLVVVAPVKALSGLANLRATKKIPVGC
jgi:hypothetical protein